MLNAIASPTFPASSGSGASPAGLEAQLARCQKELSAQVNCSSAKTPEGKVAIETLSNKISVLKDRIEEAVNSQSGGNAAAPAARPAAGAGRNYAPAAGAAEQSSRAALAEPGSADAGVGSRINVFA